MLSMILGLCILAVFALGAEFMHNRSQRKAQERGGATEQPSLAQVEDMECCGQHETCEKESLLAALSKDVEYYDDEELDRFKGREADGYSAEETDEFRDVLYTMRDVEVAGWVRSLQLRGVELPDGVKDEVLLIVGERRGGDARNA